MCHLLLSSVLFEKLITAWRNLNHFLSHSFRSVTRPFHLIQPSSSCRNRLGTCVFSLPCCARPRMIADGKTLVMKKMRKSLLVAHSQFSSCHALPSPLSYPFRLPRLPTLPLPTRASSLSVISVPFVGNCLSLAWTVEKLQSSLRGGR
jgi:hypothetical protein